MKRNFFKSLLIAGLLSSAVASAETFPNKPMSLYAGTGSGTGVDTAARLIAEAMGNRLNQKITVVNEPGSAGGIVAERFAQRAPDGHEILIATTTGIAQSLYNKNFTHTLADFKPVGVVLSFPICISVSTNSKYKTFADLVADAKTRPIAYASTGVNDFTAIFMRKFATVSNTKWTMVPYTQAAQQLTDLAGGHIPVVVSSCATQAGAIEGGIAKPLVVTTAKRHDRLKDIPTLNEYGYKGFEFTGWYMMFAHKNTTDGQMKVLHKALVDSLDDPKVKGRIWSMNSQVQRSSMADYQKFFDSQMQMLKDDLKK